jgi:minichromosome maintenance protein 10
MRLGTVCEYHVHAAVKRGRATRAEFASATTSYELTAGRTGGIGRPAGSSGGGGGGGAPGDYDSYNPRLKRGLLPSNGGRAAPRGSENGGGGATYVVGRGVARTGDAPAGHGAPGDSHLAERVGRSQAQKRKRQQELADGDAALQRLFDRSGDNGSVGAKYLFALGKVRPKERDETKQRPPSAFTAAMIESIGFDPSGRRNEDPEKRVSKSAVRAESGAGY